MAYLGKTPSQAVRSRYYFTASGGETSLAPAQVTGLSFTDANYVDVSLNGVALVSGTDYTATPSTNTISSLAALTASDVVEIVVYDTFSVFGGSVNGDFNISGGTLAAEAVTVTGLTTTGNINFGDNDKAIFGAGSDLQIYHDGAQSYVLDNGTGNLNLRGTSLRLSDASGTHYLVANSGAEVSLTHSGSTKLATASFGAQVTGSLAVDTITNATASTDVTIDTNFDIILDAGGNVGIGTSGPTEDLHIKGKDGAHADVIIQAFTGYNSGLNFNDNAGMAGRIVYNHSNNFMEFDTNGSEAMRIDSSGRVMIGGTVAGNAATISLNVGNVGLTNGGLQLWGTTTGTHYVQFGDESGTAANHYRGYMAYAHNGDSLRFGTASTERMRIDSSGNLLVGGTNSTPHNLTSGGGFSVRGSLNLLSVARQDNEAMILNRTGTDGEIVDFRKNGTTVGSIRAEASVLQIGTSDTGIDFETSNNAIRPVNISTGALRDNAITLGRPDGRFTIVYATTSTINTSDQNEKQQIASLTSAEITAAKAISKLFKTFKWNDAVAAKGDAARTHTGVIAQEVQTAMTDAGLDASKYAFWCSDTWTNDDGSEQTRLGVRYAELLAFVGAATEQRLADLETRLTALENAE